MSKGNLQKRWLVGLSVIVCALLYLGWGPGKAAHSPRHRVVFHINSGDPAVHAGALRNVKNFLAAVGDKHADIRVLLHSGGVSMVLRPEATKRTRFKYGYARGKRLAQLRALRKRGVRFLVCRNTIKNKGASRKKDLFEVPRRDMVASGVVALVKLQQAGFAYVKP